MGPTSSSFVVIDGITTTLISTPIQIFMGWRIMVIMESLFPFVVITFLALGSLGGALALSITVSITPQFAKFDDFRAAPIIWLMTSALADVVIAIYLAKKKSNLSILNDQVDRIIRISIQTGAITAIGAATDAIVFIILPHSTVLNARNNYRYRNVKAGPTPNALFDYSEDTSTTFSLDPRTTQSRTLNDSIPMYSPPKTKIGISTVTETYQSPDVEMAPGGEHWRRPPQFPPPRIYTASPPPRGSSSRSSSRAENRVPAYSSNTTLVAGPDSGSQASRPYIPQPQPRQKPAPF
ncbi:hypothetical protein D9758_018477 [Tetrapyrgos nigripes]|uniref:Uncharacterized protein n=1 Tax=Tetrapyrgos nigripes TaxID=182062 RepID=A0A8H5AVY3_9AGAR|nr:hypothetical protein D9758_018477 [Tetrapyrgos nigripes]